MVLGTQELAQQELLEYLGEQIEAIAPESAHVTVDNTTYLTVIDEDRSERSLLRLIALLRNAHGEERLLDLVTNNDRFDFLVKVVRDNFAPQWRYTGESWPGDVPF